MGKWRIPNKMTPREIIHANIKHKDSERIGLNFDNSRRNDIYGVAYGSSSRWKEKRWMVGNVEYYDDEWGNTWYRMASMGKGGEIFKPAIDNWEKLDSYILPELANPLRYRDIPQKIAETEDFYHIGSLPGFPFAICRYLRKMETYFQDLILERKRIDILHQRVTDLLERMIEQYAKSGVDGIVFCEDWGTQERLLISPAMWREIFKPIFKRLCGVAHECKVDVLMHSCGYNWAILDDLAEVGVNVFQFDQPRLYDLESLSEKLRRLKVCLWSPVDIQKILPTGNRELIESESKKMVELFRGGLIVKNYGDLHGIDVKPEWDQWAYQAFLKAGVP